MIKYMTTFMKKINDHMTNYNMTKFGHVIKDHKLATKNDFWSLICNFGHFSGHLYLIVWSRNKRP